MSEKKMNMENRKKLVLAMEMLCKAVNNEDYLDSWLMCGVADGDISPNSVDVSEVDDVYISDSYFGEMMGLFLRIMSRANKDGGLYFDGVVSQD